MGVGDGVGDYMQFVHRRWCLSYTTEESVQVWSGIIWRGALY